jgi:hypothetical protein
MTPGISPHLQFIGYHKWGYNEIIHFRLGFSRKKTLQLLGDPSYGKPHLQVTRIKFWSNWKRPWRSHSSVLPQRKSWRLWRWALQCALVCFMGCDKNGAFWGNPNMPRISSRKALLYNACIYTLSLSIYIMYMYMCIRMNTVYYNNSNSSNNGFWEYECKTQNSWVLYRGS